MSSTLFAMASLGDKLQRLGTAQRLAKPPPTEVAPSSLDELRDRIASILARGPATAPASKADPSAGELPFCRVTTPRGPLYLRRERMALGVRVGRAPLCHASSADPGILALLALDAQLSGLDPKRALYIDTETTGLGVGAGTVPFLIGLAWSDPENGDLVLEQFLLRNLGEEAPMLELLASRIRDASFLVSYNGKSFDLPLLRSRFVMNRMDRPPEPPHLDLVHVARRIHGARLRSCSLTAIEASVLGEERMFDVAGADVVACYAHYLRTGDESALLGVVEHNAMDVRSMVALVGLYGEPLGQLVAEDLVGVAKTVARAGDLAQAEVWAEHAVTRGGGPSALRARGDIARARGEKARALRDYETLARDVDDPSVRLALAKLYEHHVGAYALALAALEGGTGESTEAVERRRKRLQRKLNRPRS